MKRLIFIAVMAVATSALAQQITNDAILNKLWHIALQVDSKTMASESEKEFGIKIALPIEPVVAPSPALMQSGVGLTSWLFNRQNLGVLQTGISSVRYERMHYYADNSIRHRLSIGVDAAKNCILTDEVKEFLIKRRKNESAFRSGGLTNPKDSLHSDPEEKQKRGNGIYSLGVRHSRVDKKPLDIWFSFNYYQCLQSFTVLQD